MPRLPKGTPQKPFMGTHRNPNYRTPKPVETEPRVIGSATPVVPGKGGRYKESALQPAPPPKRSPEEVPTPKFEEHELRTEARRRFPNDQERQDAYVYGVMRNQGWKPDHHSP